MTPRVYAAMRGQQLLGKFISGRQSTAGIRLLWFVLGIAVNVKTILDAGSAPPLFCILQLSAP